MAPKVRIWHARGQTQAWPKVSGTWRHMARAPTPVSRHRQPESVGDRGNRPGAGGTTRAGAGAPAASGFTPRRRRHGGRARPWRPPPRWRRGRRRAAPRTAPATPRAVGPSPGHARSPPNQHIEHKFDSGSGTLRSPTGLLRTSVGRAGAATQRNLGDNSGQQGITNREVSGGSRRLAWGAKLLDWAFTRQRPQGPVRRFSSISRPALRPATGVPALDCVSFPLGA
jgi:hypothetical protein